MKRGDWVNTEMGVGWIVHIASTSSWSPIVKVELPNNKIETFVQSAVEPIPTDLSSDDYLMLQILAVDTHDQQWFEELGERSRAADAVLQE